MLRSLLYVSAVSSAMGHANLFFPLPFQGNAQSTAGPCAGKMVPPVNGTQVLKGGEDFTIRWNIVATDGSGPIWVNFNSSLTAGSLPSPMSFPTTRMNAAFDTMGKSYTGYYGNVTVMNFTKAAGVTTYNVTIPSTVFAALPIGNTVMQVRNGNANGGWYSCVMLDIVAVAVPTPAPTPTCTTAQGLSFCSAVNGQQIGIPAGFDAVSYNAAAMLAQDALLKAEANDTLINPAVWRNGTGSNDTTMLSAVPSAECIALWKRARCALAFPACSAGVYQTNICNSACQALVSTCVLNTQDRTCNSATERKCSNTTLTYYSHQAVWDCNNDPKFASTLSDSAGACTDSLSPAAATTFSAGLAALLFAIVTL